jgi:ankyrin repeat domain-containing protein 50
MSRREKVFRHFGKVFNLQSTPPAQDSISQADAAASTNTIVIGTPKKDAGDQATENIALRVAIERHLNDIPDTEKRAFHDASQHLTDVSILDAVKRYDEQHKSQSHFRPRASSIGRFLDVLNRFMAGVTIGIQADPAISSIVVGAVRVVIDLAIGFVDFFAKLSEMLDRFSDFLGPLAKYATSSENSQLVLESLVNVYVDLLTFCRRARAVFVDESGTKRQLTSWRVFWRLQWIPFEEEFGKIAADMQHHLHVLDHSVRAESFGISIETLRSERDRQVKEEGLCCSV